MATNRSKKQQAPKPKDIPSKPSLALEFLNALVGEWSVEGSHVHIPNTLLRGRKTYEWLEGRRFLIERSHIDHPEMPDSIAIIGADEGGAPLAMHYFDSRGVSRTYQMSLRDGTWKAWRDAPGFSQRFTGTFSNDGKTIQVLYELSSDGVSWEDDMYLTFTKAGAGESKQELTTK